MSFEDRAYQARALTQARASLASGHRAPLLVAPTGAGKTTIAGMIVQGAIAKQKRVAMLAHRRELIDQAAKRFRSFGLDVGAQGLNRKAPIQVTSPHVILARREMPEADVVIVDEAHHYVADEWGQITTGYLKSGAVLVGLSATPERGDGIGLGGLFDDIIVVSQIRELTELRYLVPCEIVDPETTPNKLAREPWEAYRDHASGRSAVVFAPHVKAAEDFARGFRENLGIEAGVVEGKMHDEDRDATLAKFACGQLRVLCNVMVLTEGWDCPIADVCILARRVGSPSLFLQMVGRVLRTMVGPDGAWLLGDDGKPLKNSALLIDLAGNCELHGDPDEDRIWSLDGAACRRMCMQDANVVRECRSCHAEIPIGEARCPVCALPLPVQRTPEGEGIELRKREREERQQARASMPEDRRVRMLATLYAKGIRKGHRRKGAEHAYRGMTGSFPEQVVAVRAWHEANEVVAKERGDAWEPATLTAGQESI